MRGSMLGRIVLLIAAIIIALVALKILTSVFWVLAFLVLAYVVYRVLEGWAYRRH